MENKATGNFRGHRGQEILLGGEETWVADVVQKQD